MIPKPRKVELSAKVKEDSKRLLGEFAVAAREIEAAMERLGNKQRYKETLGERLLNRQLVHLSVIQRIHDMNIAVLFKLVALLADELGIELDVPAERGIEQSQMLDVTRDKVN